MVRQLFFEWFTVLVVFLAGFVRAALEKHWTRALPFLSLAIFIIVLCRPRNDENVAVYFHATYWSLGLAWIALLPFLSESGGAVLQFAGGALAFFWVFLAPKELRLCENEQQNGFPAPDHALVRLCRTWFAVKLRASPVRSLLGGRGVPLLYILGSMSDRAPKIACRDELVRRP
jgi:hypothetical protein